MSADLVPASWPRLTAPEIQAVLERLAPGSVGGEIALARPLWHSPRPMSVAAIVGNEDWRLFVKRHHHLVKRASDVALEHAFAAHLRGKGQPIPALMSAADGTTVIEIDDFVYEVHAVATGLDLYGDVPSWAPFISLEHASSAGAALAKFHLAARDFDHATRPSGVLYNSSTLSAAKDPGLAIDAHLRERPALSEALSATTFQIDAAHDLVGALSESARALGELRPQWAHGDWHPSNLTWSSRGRAAEVVEILDLGLSNLTYAVHDLAVALERSTIDWLHLSNETRTGVDFEAIDALLDGYERIRPLEANERTALPSVLPVVHVEYAMSEIEYFSSIVNERANADLAYEYLIGHTRWFTSDDGRALLEHLRARSAPHHSGSR